MQLLMIPLLWENQFLKIRMLKRFCGLFQKGLVQRLQPQRSFVHELPKGEIVSIFMLANSWVGQNSVSIELYFLICFRMDCGCVPRRAEAKKRRKREDRVKHSSLIDQTADAPLLFGWYNRSEPLFNRSDRRRLHRKVSRTATNLFPFDTLFPNLSQFLCLKPKARIWGYLQGLTLNPKRRRS